MVPGALRTIIRILFHLLSPGIFPGFYPPPQQLLVKRTAERGLRQIGADPTVYEFMRPLQDWNVFVTMAAFVLASMRWMYVIE